MTPEVTSPPPAPGRRRRATNRLRRTTNRLRRTTDRLRRTTSRLRRRAASWSPTTRGLLWTIAAGLLFSLLNALMRVLAQQVSPMQSQFLRYAMGLAVLLPVVFWRGPLNYRPKDLPGQFWRGGAHTAGLVLWFLALPRIPLADMTAIGFTTPIFIMIGARLFFGEPMHWERWLATGLGFAGVLIVVGPRLGLGAGGSAGGGLWHLVMLASAPMFAASFLLTKALTRQESAGVILLWQSITVTLFSLPLALPHWGPISAAQWLGFGVCGLLGSGGHYCLTRSFAATDISATQSAKFLDLVWSALFGFVIFADVPTETTLLGGVVIAVATLWVARREGQRSGAAPAAGGERGAAAAPR
jgi:drug/metabolite transporter (DMT)-like permease